MKRLLIPLCMLLLPLTVAAALSGFPYSQQLKINGNAAGSTNDTVGVSVFFDDNYLTTDADGVPQFYLSGPTAYHYHGTYDRTYVVFAGPRTTGAGNPYITYYDHDTEKWANPVLVGTNALAAEDVHGPPTVTVRNDGKLLVTYGSRTSPLYMQVSTSAEDITSWGAVDKTTTTAASYPSLIKQANGDIWMFYMQDDFAHYDRGLFKKYTATNDTWSAATVWLHDNPGGDSWVYHGNPIYDAARGRVHFAWIIWDVSDYNYRNVYHAYLDLATLHVMDMAGHDAGVQLVESEADNAGYAFRVAVTTTNVYIPAIALDSDGYPHLMYSMASGTNAVYTYTRWTGASWQTPSSAWTVQPAAMGTNLFRTAVAPSISLSATNDITAYGTGATGDMERWHYDGASWSKVTTLLSKSIDGIYLGYNSEIANADPSLRYMFCQLAMEGAAKNPAVFPNHKVYAFGDGGFVKMRGDNRIVTGGLCRRDFGDIRFTSADGSTLLGYSPPLNVVTGGVAEFYVKVPANLTADARIFAYWGNATATNTGHTSDAFVFGEDFTRSTLDAVNWPSVTQSPSYTINAADKYMTVTDVTATAGGGGGFHSRAITFPDQWVFDNDILSRHLRYDEKPATTFNRGPNVSYVPSVNGDICAAGYSVNTNGYTTADWGIVAAGIYDYQVTSALLLYFCAVGGAMDYTQLGITGSYLGRTKITRTGGTNIVYEAAPITTSDTARHTEVNTVRPTKMSLVAHRLSGYTFGTAYFYPFTIRRYGMPTYTTECVDTRRPNAGGVINYHGSPLAP